jgi:hypothetical protein
MRQSFLLTDDDLVIENGAQVKREIHAGLVLVASCFAPQCINTGLLEHLHDVLLWTGYGLVRSHRRACR